MSTLYGDDDRIPPSQLTLIALGLLGAAGAAFTLAFAATYSVVCAIGDAIIDRRYPPEVTS